MKIEVKKLPRGQAEITIELTAEEYQPFLKQAAQNISQGTKIPGFRPGKADLEIVKKHVGENQVWQEALESAIRKTFVAAIDQEKLLTVGSPQIDVIKLAPGNPVIYKATVSLLPKIKLADYTEIKIKTKPLEIKKTEMEKRLSDLQKMRAKESLVDRGAKKGDKVEIDFETFLDKVPIDHGAQEKFPIVIGEGTFIPGFEDQLIGLKKEETKNFELKFPAEYHQKSLAGKLASFKVKVNSVFQLDLPELNDDFAKGLGQFKTIKDVEEKIAENLKTDLENQEARRLEEELIDKIIAKSSFEDIPDLLINSEAKKMVEELEHNLSHQGVKLTDYLSHLKKTQEEMLLDFAPQATRRVKSALILREVVQKENINVSDEELDGEIHKVLATYGNSPEASQELHRPEYQDYLRNALLTQKAVDRLKSIMVEK